MIKLILATTIALTPANEEAASSMVPKSGDVVTICDSEYVLIRSVDYKFLTNSIERCLKVYDKMNATEDGRRMIHGKRGHTTITNGVVKVEYEDGWTATEELKNVSRPVETGKPNTTNVPPRRVSRRDESTFPNRLAEIMNRREKLKSAKPLEITVEKMGGEK